jgi:WD40 repeat protein
VLTVDLTAAYLWPAAGPPRAIPAPRRFRAAALSPDGALLAVTGWDAAENLLFRTQDGQLVGPVPHPAEATQVAFSPDGTRLLYLSDHLTRDESATLWDLTPSGGRRRDWRPPLKHALTAAFRPGGREILLGGRDGRAVRCDADTGAVVGPPLGPLPESVTAVAFRSDGAVAATGSRGGGVRLWDVATGAALTPPFGHRAGVNSLAFSPDGRTLLSASADGTARFWDAQTGTAVGPPLRHGERTQAAYSPDGRLALTAGTDGTAQRWRAPAAALTGPADRIALWVQGITGLTLDEQGAVQQLNEADRRNRLERSRTMAENLPATD